MSREKHSDLENHSVPRLLHIMNFRPLGTRTFDHFLIGFARVLREKGWEVRYAFAGEPPVAFAQELTELGVGYVVIQFPLNRSSARDMIARLDGFRPDVTQTSFLSAFNRAALWLKLSGFTKRLIVIDHSSGKIAHRMGLKKLAMRLRGWAVGRVIDRILPVSETIACRDIQEAYLPERKVRVVLNGIRLDLFEALPRGAGEPLRVAFAGQLIPEKGVLTLLKAHNQLRQEGVTDYELNIAGKGPQEAELKEYCRNHGLHDVQFMGHIDSIPRLFGRSDIVVVPSEWHEAFGLVAAEAMASGAACLVSNAGALPEVVGDAGIIFRCGDSSDLARQLRELLTDSEHRTNLARSGRSRAEERFSLKRKIAEHVAICEELVPTPRRRN